MTLRYARPELHAHWHVVRGWVTACGRWRVERWWTLGVTVHARDVCRECRGVPLRGRDGK